MDPVTLFLCGDVMTGRGIDQILSHPCDAALHEGFMTSAIGYVELAEERSGAIPRRVAPHYIWGDALAELERVQPHVRIINLETAITRSDDWLAKGINYRMHPDNVACLTAAKVDCCALANNHVLDWGTRGLVETLDTLRLAGIKSAGAGFDLLQAEQAAVLPVVGGTRVLVYSLGMQSSGIPPDWSAQAARAGVYLVDELAEQHLERLSANIRAAKQLGDIVVASIHWGSNWGYDVSASEVRFAHRLIGEAGVDVVHGHSSHHPKAIEVHARKLILYGCGDFINDYEGIHGHDRFRPELTLMYFPTLEPASGQLLKLELVPMRMRRFRCQRASEEEVSWLCKVLQREGRGWHTHFRLHSDQRIELEAG